MKSKDLKEKKKNKFKNPLSGIPTKSLLITLFALLITFGVGFGTGYGCRAMNRGSTTITAYAAEVRQSSSISVVPYPNITISGEFYNSLNPYIMRNPMVVPSSSDYDFLPISDLPEAGSLFCLNSAGSAASSSRVVFVGFNISCQRSFTDFRSRTAGLPLLRFSRSELVYSSSSGWVKSVGYANVSCLFNLLQGADALSQATFSSDYTTRLDIHNGGFETLPYTLSYLESSTIAFDNLVSERPVYLLLPLRSYYLSVRPAGAVSSSNPVVNNFVFDYRLFTTENTDLSSNPYVDIRLSFSYRVSSLPYTFPNVTLYPDYPLKVVDYDIDESLLERYQAGYSVGHQTGFSEGQNKGFELGKEAGLTQGRNEKLEDITPWQHIVNGVNSFLNLQILPGVHISVILTITFGLILVGFLLKFYLGG